MLAPLYLQGESALGDYNTLYKMNYVCQFYLQYLELALKGLNENSPGFSTRGWLCIHVLTAVALCL